MGVSSAYGVGAGVHLDLIRPQIVATKRFFIFLVPYPYMDQKFQAFLFLSMDLREKDVESHLMPQ